MTRQRTTVPLVVWAALAAVAAGAAVLVGAAFAIRVVADAPASDIRVLLAAGGALVGVVAVVVAVGAHRFARRLRRLRSDALERLHDGTPTSAGHAVAGVSELVDLARLLEALVLRARVADELAERHRRSAETASAGMFELLSGLVAAEESARGQLSAELHDTVAQSLALARGCLAGDVPNAATLAAEYVSDAEEQVRAVMARTRPPALREGDLASAVENLRADLELRYGLTVGISWPPEPYPLPLVTAVTLYRFFQEGLLNVVKHANVDTAEAWLEVTEAEVVASVTDSGPGFDPASVRPDKGRHVGLGLLRERARLAGGALEVSSKLGEGTTLRLRLPRPPTPAGSEPRGSDVHVAPAAELGNSAGPARTVDLRAR